MDNKLSLHIVWPFVALWIIVAALVGGDLIPLHVIDGMGSAAKVARMMEELMPAADPGIEQVDIPGEPIDQTQQDQVVDQTVVNEPVNNQEAFDLLTEDIVQDVVIDQNQPQSNVVDDTTILIGIPVEDMGDITYILNTNSMKFHNIGCHSVELIAEENFQASFDTRDTILSSGYVPCKNCNP